jgi:LysR family hydrogen peroxide-inducible transcriptional activator
MTLQQLKYIIAIDNYKSFSEAAIHCFVNQSTITIQVKKLEEEIGFQLFDRSKTPLKVTENGKKIVDKARMILREVNQMKAMVNKEKESVEGKYRIGIIPTLSPYIVPDFSGGFSKNNPNTVLEIEELESNDIISQLKNGKIDIGILATPLGDKDIREIRMYNEPFVFYGHPSHPLLEKKGVTPSNLEGLSNLWLLKEGHCVKNQVLNICEHPNENRSIQFESGSIETLKRMVKKYGGYTLIPEMSIDETDKESIAFFKSPQPTREVSLAVHKDFAKENLLINIRKEILKIIPKAFTKNERFISIKWR